MKRSPNTPGGGAEPLVPTLIRSNKGVQREAAGLSAFRTPPGRRRVLAAMALLVSAAFGASCTDANGYQPGEPKPDLTETEMVWLHVDGCTSNPIIEKSDEESVRFGCPYSKESPDEPEIVEEKPGQTDGKYFRVIIDKPGAGLKPDKSTKDSDVGTTGGGKIEGPPRQF